MNRITSTLLFVLCSICMFSQNQSVSGTVTDIFGDPLPGVDVVIKGTVKGASTDFDGKYSINKISPSDVLIISSIGYTPQEIPIGDKTVINVNLEESQETLEEVVVIGYGTAKKSELTGSISSLKGETLVEQTVSTSIDQALQGRAAGVNISLNSGAPGASSNINIRGVSSINSRTQPIFVIDGVIIQGDTNSSFSSPLDAINPNDIESIDILKDASATAIYGSRASNGVIIITTKRGKKGRLNFGYDTYIGFQEIPKKLDVLNLQEYAIHKNTRSEYFLVPRDADFIRPDLLGEGTDWQDELFTQALMQNHYLSASGGNKNTTFAMGIGYLDQEGIAYGSGYNRFNIRGVLDSQVTDFVKLGVNLNLSNVERTDTFTQNQLIRTALTLAPKIPTRNADGSFAGSNDNFSPNNPLAQALINENRIENFDIRANTYVEFSFLDFKLKTDYTLNTGFGNRYRFDPSYNFSEFDNRDNNFGLREKRLSKFWSWSNTLNYTKTLGNHNINTVLGYEMQEYYGDRLEGTRTNYLSNNITDLAAGDPSTALNENTSNGNTMISYFGRINYSFNNRYYLTGTIRRDGSSKFIKENRWGWFPSAALAWKVSNEKFLQDSSTISNLKLRLGWGEVGNQFIPEYQYTSLLSAVPTTWGTGVLASNTANPELKWETTSSYNAGLDIGLFDDRVNIVTDVYLKQTDDLIIQEPLPSTVGTEGTGSTSPPWKNIGSLENKGFEFTLNTKNIKQENIQWNTDITFSLNKNKVIALNNDSGAIDESINFDNNIVTRTVVGLPIGMFYGYKVIGRFEKATDFYSKDTNGNIIPVAIPASETISENSVWIGDYIYEDINKDGVIDVNDVTVIGNPHPDFTFGIGNTFKFKNWDFNMFMTGSYGNDIANYQRIDLENPNSNNNILASTLGYARLELIDPNGPNDYRNVHIVGGDPHMPRMGRGGNDNDRFSDRYIEDGSFLRIKNISLGYNFSKDLIDKIGLQSLRLYTNTQNVVTFTKYTGYDPEVGAINQRATLSGIDNGRYPAPLIFTLGLNAKF